MATMCDGLYFFTAEERLQYQTYLREAIRRWHHYTWEKEHMHSDNHEMIALLEGLLAENVSDEQAGKEFTSRHSLEVLLTRYSMPPS